MTLQLVLRPGTERKRAQARVPVLPKNRNASRVARRSTERDNYSRIDSWYSRGKSGEGKKEKDNAEAQRTQRRAEENKGNETQRNRERREEKTHHFQKANPKRWASRERCKVKIVSPGMSVVHPPFRRLRKQSRFVTSVYLLSEQTSVYLFECHKRTGVALSHKSPLRPLLWSETGKL
jgi:hypothetical protein